MKKENIKWIFFDVGGVILDDTDCELERQVVLLEIAKKYKPGLTMGQVLDAWMESSKIPGSVRNNALRILLSNDADYEKALAEYIPRFPHGYYQQISHIRSEAKDVLKILSKRYQLGIMANQSSLMTKLFEEAEILKYFSYNEMSADTGFEKPDPKYFEVVFTKSGAGVHESVLVDDNWYRGLLPAQKIGMSTILFKREIIPYPEHANPDYAITKLEELLDLFC